MIKASFTKFLNFLIFQLGWFLAVYFHNNYVAGICLLLFLVNISISTRKTPRYILFTVLVASIGFLTDLLWYKLEIIDFNQATPWWLFTLWLLFVSTFAESMSWLSGCNLFVLSLLGCFGGALSYYFGVKLGAIIFAIDTFPSYLFFGLNWAILFPILFTLHAKYSKS